MTSTSTIIIFYQNVRNLYHKISSSGSFGVPASRFIFKPNKKTTIQTPNIDTNENNEKYNQRPNNHPVAEKQTLLKKKKKVKVSE